jgi:hypothetical protein
MPTDIFSGSGQRFFAEKRNKWSFGYFLEFEKFGLGRKEKTSELWTTWGSEKLVIGVKWFGFLDGEKIDKIRFMGRILKN